MWLLNTKTYKLEHFLDDRRVTYAILSHCWTDNEVSFAEFQRVTNAPNISIPDDTPGWRKIRSACRMARHDRIQYIWIDTCAIDKSSSAELSEAINSMYRWYESAKVCYAYLEDIGQGKDLVTSRWFTRGWTLQELIAPGELLFYDRDWQLLGSRVDYHFAIQTAAKIPATLLRGVANVNSFSIAQRMSWASQRETTRAEDMAYSLMGLFGVNMPMLYGEGGERAFLRLQEEIIKLSTDQTIFAWRIHDKTAYKGLLAHSVAQFTGCGRIEQQDGAEEVSFQQTNAGLSISLRGFPYALNVYHVELLAKEDHQSIGILLGFPAGTGPSDRVGRLIHMSDDGRLFPSDKPMLEFIQKQFVVPRYPFQDSVPQCETFGFRIRTFKIAKLLSHVLDPRLHMVTQLSSWNAETNVVARSHPTVGSVVAFALPTGPEDWWVFLKLGFTANFDPWAWVYPGTTQMHAPRNFTDLVIMASKVKLRHVPHNTKRFYDLTRGLSIDKSALKNCITSESMVISDHHKMNASLPGYHLGARDTGLYIHSNGLTIQITRVESGPSVWAIDVTPTTYIVLAKDR